MYEVAGVDSVIVTILSLEDASLSIEFFSAVAYSGDTHVTSILAIFFAASILSDELL